ncbi:TIGR01212 family radical SAM protein [Sharpea azabuensis]|uniref:TIGR01212 family radical SAM protein n=1 Tax=Sharpea azabuensis TaxID=322505 RepID=UPI0012DF45EA|nr:TIGR01212 family radical SAM protein [Sharpea azabuensis]
MNLNNPFPYSFDNKRYHTYNYFLKTRYHKKIAKVALNADFTCPNRDGKVGVGGCLFCSESGSGDFAGNVNDSLTMQFDKQAQMMLHKWPEASFIAYFQAFTNTYAPVAVLKSRFEPFVDKENVVGIAIATRADCITEEIASYLEDLNTRTDVYIELGLQTIHDESAKRVNRGEDFATFKKGLAILRQHHLEVCVHIINGLPYESEEMMLETAKAVGQLNIQALKIHSLYLMKHAPLYYQYLKEPFPIMSRDAYIHLVVKQLEYIPANIVIERLTGDAPGDDLYEPQWSRNKTTILNDIDKLMKAHDIIQGDKL